MHFRIFELWRLTAALLIMAWHFLRFAPPGHEAVSIGLYRLMPVMEMFFMISGFLIMLRYVDTLGVEPGAYRRFLVRRIARFYPLYLVTLLFFVAVAVAVNTGLVTSEDPRRYGWGALLANVLLVQAWGFTETLTYNYVAWCMSAEWLCYLFLPVIVMAFRWFGIPGIAVIALASIAALEWAVASRIIPFDSWLKADTWGAYRAFADFALGALVAMAVRDSRLTLRSHAPGWMLFALAIAAMATLQDSYLIVGLLAAAMFFCALAERNNQDGSAWSAFLHPVGKVSMGIYLIHPVVETIFLSLGWRRLLEPMGVMSFYVYWLLPMAIVVALAMLSERYFERPAAKWLNGLAAGRGSSASEPVRQPAE